LQRVHHGLGAIDDRDAPAPQRQRKRQTARAAADVEQSAFGAKFGRDAIYQGVILPERVGLEAAGQALPGVFIDRLTVGAGLRGIGLCQVAQEAVAPVIN
jgi:hypothetical protein